MMKKKNCKFYGKKTLPKILLILGVFGKALCCQYAFGSQMQVEFVLGKEIITSFDVEQRLHLACLLSGTNQEDGDHLDVLRKKIRTMLLQETFQLSRAKEYQFVVAPEEVASYIQEMEKREGMEPGFLYKMLEKHQIPRKVFERSIEAKIVWSRYIHEKYRANISVSNQEVSRFLRQEKHKIRRRQYYVAEIVFYAYTPVEVEEALVQADGIMSMLRQRVPFVKLAQQFSQAPSQKNRGLVGWISEEEAALVLRPQLRKASRETLLGPVKIPGGVQILAVIQVREPVVGGEILENFSRKERESARHTLELQKLDALSQKELKEFRQNVYRCKKIS
jgi:peptidyl-prolyl cis-trans isomerase SurA